MKNILYVVLNDQTVLEFDRNKALPAEHRQYLDNMDGRMDEGIQFEDDFISPPNLLQKAQFVANSMLTGLLTEDSNQAIAMCTYLGDRIPDLKQIVCKGQDDAEGIQVEFVYEQNREQDRQPQPQTINFFDPKKFVKH